MPQGTGTAALKARYAAVSVALLEQEICTSTASPVAC